jgi:predicted secreted protein
MAGSDADAGIGRRAMTWVQGVVAYVIIWWLVVFAVLPFGVRPVAESDIGHAAGAPENPRLWLKAGITTLIATAIWLMLYALVRSDLISFRQP